MLVLWCSIGNIETPILKNTCVYKYKNSLLQQISSIPLCTHLNSSFQRNHKHINVKIRFKF